ncbi:hypothetical protein Poli38472_010154 [Pythium oligandrum]|uniref:Arrestin C-terminal-like domain-containing protein n=1 Tax=Pythium oligandrum TaxID=41045 RepID=A0A8K1C973_PYTOL|nr:hypothetical protein Poli38472_010154 [Pythium oligandrum]|eukprot:TMW58595.1 hypothetical protein Poli38472_010154 [Pythium oligandrum]
MGRLARKLHVGVRGSLDIELEHSCILPGETIKGYVRLHVKKPIVTSGLSVIIGGWERLYWETTDHCGMRWHRRSFKLLHVPLPLFEPGTLNGATTTINAGTYDYPFACQLPSVLPASFEYTAHRIQSMERVRVSIVYSVDASLAVEGFMKADLMHSAPFVIPPGIRSLPVPVPTDQPLVFVKRQDVRALGMIKQGAFHVSMTLESNIIDASSTIVAHVQLENASKSPLKAICLRLVEDISIDRHRKHFNRTRSTSRVIGCRFYAAKTLKAMLSRASGPNLTLQLPVTPNDIYGFEPLLPTMSSQHIIALRYRVELECSFTLSEHICVEAPVLVIRGPSRALLA